MFNEKKAEFERLIDNIRVFVTDGDILPLLEKLLITKRAAWMSDDDFEATKNSCTRGKPMFLVSGPSVAGTITYAIRTNYMRVLLGTTSSGKSTLINAMMGSPLLPTSHNATTSSLCEIKYGQNKEAVLHFEIRAEETDDGVETLDLEKKSDRERFAALVTQREKQEKRKVLKAEVFLPFKFFEVLKIHKGTDISFGIISCYCRP